MSAPGELLRIYADPVGAANVMRELVTRPRLSSRLLEDGSGRWQVVVRGAARGERVLARVLDLVLRLLEESRLQFATIEFGGRTITVGRPSPSPAAA